MPAGTSQSRRPSLPIFAREVDHVGARGWPRPARIAGVGMAVGVEQGGEARLLLPAVEARLGVQLHLGHVVLPDGRRAEEARRTGRARAP